MLVSEERIPILAITYAPNLWKLFLMYARDPVGKALPTVHMSPFPEPAQFIEKILHGVPEGCPYRYVAALTHSLAYSLATHLLTLTHSYSLAYSITGLLTHSLAYSLAYSLTHSLTYLLTYSLTHSLTH